MLKSLLGILDRSLGQRYPVSSRSLYENYNSLGSLKTQYSSVQLSSNQGKEVWTSITFDELEEAIGITTYSCTNYNNVRLFELSFSNNIVYFHYYNDGFRTPHYIYATAIGI